MGVFLLIKIYQNPLLSYIESKHYTKSFVYIIFHSANDCCLQRLHAVIGLAGMYHDVPEIYTNQEAGQEHWKHHFKTKLTTEGELGEGQIKA